MSDHSDSCTTTLRCFVTKNLKKIVNENTRCLKMRNRIGKKPNKTTKKQKHHNSWQLSFHLSASSIKLKVLGQNLSKIFSVVTNDDKNWSNVLEQKHYELCKFLYKFVLDELRHKVKKSKIK